MVSDLIDPVYKVWNEDAIDRNFFAFEATTIKICHSVGSFKMMSYCSPSIRMGCIQSNPGIDSCIVNNAGNNQARLKWKF